MIYRFYGGIADGVEALLQEYKDVPTNLWVEHDPENQGLHGLKANLKGYGCPYRLNKTHNGVSDYSVHMKPIEPVYDWQQNYFRDKID